MKKVFVFSITLGIIFSLILYLNYKKNNIDNQEFKYVYFLQISAYENIENVYTLTKTLNNYLVIKENDNLYHVYIGITKNQKNSQKIKEFYNKNGNNIYVREKLVNCKNLFFELDNYEKLLDNASNLEEYEKIEKEILKKYKEYNCEDKRDGAM